MLIDIIKEKYKSSWGNLHQNLRKYKIKNKTLC